jgi:chromosome segregation ATPase
MRLLSLEVENFRAIQSARLRFGRGLNVIYGPNDHGKSTLTDAIRAALLVVPGTAEARSFQTWGGVAGQFPRVLLGFESQGVVWRVEKVFAQGTRVKARLEKSTDGGVRYLTHAESRDVEGKLRELLNWGIAPPGGRGAPLRAETYLTTALLGRQGEVGSIFEATLKRDQDDTGRALVIQALDALGQDPVVARLLGALKERTGEAYTETGRYRRGADSPLVRAQATLREREARVRELQEAARRGKEIEDEIRALVQERETALDEHDRARTRVDVLHKRLASTARRDQLQRDAAALWALEAARQEYSLAQKALEAVGSECEQAARTSDAAETVAKEARDRLSRAQAANDSADEIAAAAHAARVSELRAQLEKAGTLKAAVQEWETLQSRHAAAEIALAQARQDELRAAAELNLATALDEQREAIAMTEALTAAASDTDQKKAREAAAAAAVAEGDAAVRAALARLDNAQNAEEQARRTAEAHGMNLRVLDTQILHSEAAVRDGKETLDRARIAVLRARRADEAQSAANAAEARAAEIDASLTANAALIGRCEARLRALESAALELRRRAATLKVEEMSAQESAAREHRRRAADARDRATVLEAEVAGVRFPSSQHLASLEALRAELKSRKAGGPAAAPPVTSLVLLAGAAGAAAAFIAARYVASAGTVVSIGATLLASIIAAAIAVFASIGGRRRSAETTWRSEIERLETRLAAETAPVLSEAGVGAIEEIESKRQQVERLHSEAGRLRQEATGLDREADSMFESAAGLSTVRRELETLNDQMISLGGGVASAPEPGGWGAVNEDTLGEQERLAEAHRVRDQLQTERISQVALCAVQRATAERALAELGDMADPQAVADAESRYAAATEKLAELRQERQYAAAIPDLSPTGEREAKVRQAEQEAARAERRAENLRLEHQDTVHDLARATARLELASRAADGIRLAQIQERLALARESAGAGAVPFESDVARMRHAQAEARVTTALANVELLAAGIPEARSRAEGLGSVAAATEEERRLQGLLDSGTQAPRDPAAVQERQDAKEKADRAEQHLTDMRARAAATLSNQAQLKERADQARGELEAAQRQTLGLDPESTRIGLAEVEAVQEVPGDEILLADSALETAAAVLTACEGRLNEARGKLGLVAGRVGLERLEEEQDAVQRAREYAEEQELDFEASRHLLESLEAAETRRSSHLGRCLAAPVTERFLSLTGDLYAHVELDPDLHMEGFVAAGGTRRLEELSVGTREQLATIVRLAIAAQLKTAVLLDDQLVHSDSERLEWFRRQLQNSVRAHDHQIIVMTCRLEDYTANNEIVGCRDETCSDGSAVTIINVLDVLRRLT